jgi:hypothetical protein
MEMAEIAIGRGGTGLGSDDMGRGMAVGHEITALGIGQDDVLVKIEIRLVIVVVIMPIGDRCSVRFGPNVTAAFALTNFQPFTGVGVSLSGYIGISPAGVTRKNTTGSVPVFSML